ncbi:hypothetical protein NKI63_11485, partial [Mesorhizobium sp. M0410]|uniref:hypothetical protein n=1 Tax=Mesorhizobium sp. M0410 TaxID=2956943 RepID=UPI0033380D53
MRLSTSVGTTQSLCEKAGGSLRRPFLIGNEIAIVLGLVDQLVFGNPPRARSAKPEDAQRNECGFPSVLGLVDQL